jgi:hypothetical protein
VEVLADEGGEGGGIFTADDLGLSINARFVGQLVLLSFKVLKLKGKKF